MGRITRGMIFFLAFTSIFCASAFAAPPYIELGVGSTKQAHTAAGYSWMPTYLGGPDQLYSIMRLGPLSAGKSYAVSLIFDAGTDIGYAISWMDGDPAVRDSFSLVGIGTGTGTREMKGKRATYLFTIDAKSTSNTMYLLVRSNRPWDFSAELVNRPAGLSRDSQDAWGYYYVSDFDFDRTSPFLLTKGSPSPAAAPAASGYIEVAPGSEKKTVTAAYLSMPNFFGGPDQLYAVYKLAPLAAGRKYEVTLTFDAGTDIGYAMAWVDGEPLGKDYASFLGTGTGTGTREMKGKKEKYRFTIDAKSTKTALYLIVRSNKPFEHSIGITDRLTGVSPSSQDAWGYYYVSDFDESRYSPFLLTRGGN